MYQRSAGFYDLIYSASRFKPVEEWADEVHAIIQERNPAAGTLLDVACGTGHHLSYLRDHYSAEGVDISEEMLRVARARLPDVPLHHADMRTLDLGRTFDAVTCLFSSIGYAQEPDELATTDEYVAAVEAAGLRAEVLPDYMPDRDRVIGVKP